MSTQNLQNTGIPVTMEALMSKECAKNSNILFNDSHGWSENFMKLDIRKKTEN
jgi:hypothetical protein